MKYKGAYQELTEEEKEELERDLAALNYFTAAYYYEIKPILDEKEKVGDIMQFCRNLMGKDNGGDLADAITKAFELGCIYKQSKADVQNFFLSDLNDADRADIKEKLKSLDMKENTFAVLALAATGDDMQKVSGAIHNKAKAAEIDPQVLAAIKGNSVMAARQALQVYKDGDPKLFASILAIGLKNSCKGFAGAKTNEDSILWSSYTEDILYLLESKPELIKESGLTENQLNIARQARKYGQDIIVGIQTVELASNAEKYNIEFSLEQAKDLKERIKNMQDAVSRRPKLMLKWDEPVKAKTGEIPKI